MKFENARVMNFDGAFRGLRNHLESWSKSDSEFYIAVTTDGRTQQSFEHMIIGPNDLNLAQRMIKAGSSDRKFMRQIFVSVDITAPLYWWKEADTYKIATVANSTSTMHKLSSTPITIDCFEIDDYEPYLKVFDGEPYNPDYNIADMWDSIINVCETLRKRYNETKDQRYWKELIRILPEGWLQTRTWTANYEVLRTIYTQRQHHRLTEWHSFCNWIQTLPYAKELILYSIDK